MKLAKVRPNIGETFNPYRRFNGLFVPEPIARSRDLPPGAKLVYGRLLRFAGKDGHCWPAVETLAEEVAIGERQVQKHLRTLEEQRFIRREKRFKDRAQTSNYYVFLWHPIFDEYERKLEAAERVNNNSPSPVHSGSLAPVNSSSHKESQLEEKCTPHGGVNLYSPKETHQRMGELDPVHLGSPKESHGDSVPFLDLGFYSVRDE